MSIWRQQPIGDPRRRTVCEQNLRGVIPAAARAAHAPPTEATNVNELVNELTKRVGLSPDQATQAVEVILGFVKGRLPAPIASQLDGMLGQTSAANTGAGASGAPANDSLGGIASELGGLFGR